MFHLTQGEMFLYGGIAALAIAFVSTVVCIIIFRITGKKIRQKLEQDYGKKYR